jgi:uncharacterized protein involved in tolerance to divalent cations
MENKISHETDIKAEDILRNKYKEFLHIDKISSEIIRTTSGELVEYYARNTSFFTWYSNVIVQNEIDLSIKWCAMNALEGIMKSMKQRFSNKAKLIISQRMNYLLNSEFNKFLPALSIKEWLLSNNITIPPKNEFIISNEV